jgi:hypothetical protein
MDLQKYLATTAASPKRKSKYNNTITKVGAKTFHSKREAKRYQELQLLVRAKKIRDLQLQVPYDLIPAQYINGTYNRPIRYMADFVYEEDGRTIVEDVKGVRTDGYKLKRRLMKLFHNIDIRET